VRTNADRGRGCGIDGMSDQNLTSSTLSNSAGHKPGEKGATEAIARANLAALYRILAQLGFDDLIYTHLAARVPDQPDQMLMSPMGILFEEVRASTLIKLSLALEPAGAAAGACNKIGYRLHSAIFRAHPEATCTVHLHTPAGVAVSSHSDGLLPLSQPAMLFTARIAYHENEGLVFDAGEQTRLVRNLAGKKVMFLRNHGTLVWGCSFAEAFELTYNLERACQVQVAALSAYSKPCLPPKGIPELTQAQYASFGAARDSGPSWQAVLRNVERLDPDYKS
jgi:ribulose-5-phosphate 4-epimerase/fuculose-1-phosphate aldolase